MSRDDIVVGILLGDESKGSTVSFLCEQAFEANRRTHFVVRFSGGPQTAHNVIHNGIHHTFNQFGSGSLQGIPTILTRFVVINPFNLMQEGYSLIQKTGMNPFNGLLISENALLITPIHRWINQQKEIARGAAAHGSCGEGVGETRAYELGYGSAAPKMKDLLPGNIEELKSKLATLIQYAEEAIGTAWTDEENSLEALYEDYVNLSQDGFLNIVEDWYISERLNDGYNIWEGSQGVLLDESLGFYPHTTWSSVTPANAQMLLEEAGKERGNVIGVVRTYFTRHGAGPLPSEIEDTEENRKLFPEAHNTYGRFQGGWRRGWFDLPLFEYAVRAAGGVDELMVSHADKFFPNMPVVTDYADMPHIPSDFYDEDFDQQEKVTRYLMSKPVPAMKEVPSLESLFGMIEEVSGVPVKYVSYGKTSADKKTLY
jgi:adenylosuccinate synthase